MIMSCYVFLGILMVCRFMMERLITSKGTWINLDVVNIKTIPTSQVLIDGLYLILQRKGVLYIHSRRFD